MVPPAARPAPDLTGRPTDVVQRVRLQYAKRGPLRFTSHRDIARAFERALRRAGVPMAYSSGFTAHPRISWVGAAPTGVASEAEYVEIGLAEQRDPEQVRAALDASLPPGLDVVAAVTATTGGFAERVEAAQWEVRLDGVDAHALARAVAALLAADRVEVERLTKDGRRTVDVRGALAAATVRSGQCAILDLVVRQTTPAVRPDDVLAALRSVAGLLPPVPASVVRLAQGRLAEDGSIADPLGPDRPGAADAGTGGVAGATASGAVAEHSP